MNRTILVIDDDKAVQKVLVQHLSNGSIRVDAASDGESGFEMARTKKPDLILLDVDMPGMDGHEVCRRLKFDPATKGIPIAFLTAESSVGDKIVGLDQGAVDYITKPFDPSEVAARARAAFRVKSMVELAGANTMVDSLTGLGNRPSFEQHIRVELARTHRSAESLVVMLLEPGRLDQVSNQEGEETTDGVLFDIARILKETCREEDRIFRYTDRQFAIIAPNVRVIDMPMLGERLRTDIESHPVLRRRTSVAITISIGLAFNQFSMGRSVVEEAAEALLRAKTASEPVVTAGEITQPRLAI